MTANVSVRLWYQRVLAWGVWLVLLAILGQSVGAAEQRSGSARQREARRTSALEPVPETAPPRKTRSAPQPDLVYEDPLDSFGDVDDGCDSGCCRPSCFWGDVEYLMWWRRGRSLPPLVTTSTAGTAQASAGVLGLNSTSTLYGNDDVGNGARPGGRLSLGVWCDDSHCWGIGGRSYFLGQSSTQFNFSDAENTIIGRPFLNVSDNQVAAQDALLVAFPGIRTGNISVLTNSDVLGGDAFLRRVVYQNCGARIDLILGYQFARINEELTIRSSTDARDLGAVLDVTDNFRTYNEFNGGAFGFMYQVDRGCWQCNGLIKVGFGNMHQTAILQGSQTITAGPPVTNDEGLLVQSTNRGTFTRDQFVLAPELGLTLTYKINRCWDLSCGYSLLVYNRVLQPGGTIDPNLAVNLSDPPIAAQRPAFAFNDNDYWIHGLNFGCQWRF